MRAGLVDALDTLDIYLLALCLIQRKFFFHLGIFGGKQAKRNLGKDSAVEPGGSRGAGCESRTRHKILRHCPKFS